MLLEEASLATRGAGLEMSLCSGGAGRLRLLSLRKQRMGMRVCGRHVQELQGCPPCTPGDAMGWWFCAGAEEPPVPLWWADPSQRVGNGHGNLQSSCRDSLSTPLLLLCLKETLVPPT